MDWKFCPLSYKCPACEKQAEILAEAAVWQETDKQLEKLQD